MKLSGYFYKISPESVTHKLSEGRINLCSPDHLSLLVHRTFNVSILRQHLPFEEYEFEYGPAENDPEFSVRIANETTAAEQKGAGEDQEVRDPGRWVHRKSGVPLGGVERTIEFTVIGCVELWLTYDPIIFSGSQSFLTISSGFWVCYCTNDQCVPENTRRPAPRICIVS